jgi:hypothetical protein
MTMASLQVSTERAVALGVLTLIIAVPPLAFSQGRGSGPRYDLTTEVTVSGTVESVDQIPGSDAASGKRGLGGTHLTLKTTTETLEVHLGPTAFLAEKKLTVATRDPLVIVGSRVMVDGDRVFIAREVKKGDSTWTLRDAAGLPLWRGRAGQR